MTFIQKHLHYCFLMQSYGFKSAAGYPVLIDHEKCTDRKIVGYVCFDSYNMPLEWDLNGKPLKLPLHQGLGLVPIRKVESYEVIPVEERI